MFQTLDFTTPMMPEDKPRYLMGVGKPADIVGAVMRGVDMFDCVLPTRSGRTAQGFTRRGLSIFVMPAIARICALWIVPAAALPV